MYNFALLKIPELVGQLCFYKLSVNGKCEFDLFEKEIQKDGNLKRELLKIQTRLQEIAEGKILPPNKFKDITPKGEMVKEYEVKSDHLRVYFFFESNTDRIIICGGKKTTQSKDIAHFQKIKKAYLSAK